MEKKKQNVESADKQSGAKKAPDGGNIKKPSGQTTSSARNKTVKDAAAKKTSKSAVSGGKTVKGADKDKKKAEKAKAKKQAVSQRKAQAEKKRAQRQAQAEKNRAQRQAQAEIRREQKQAVRQERLKALKQKNAERIERQERAKAKREKMHAQKRLQAAKLKEEHKELKAQASEAKKTAAKRRKALIEEQRQNRAQQKAALKKLSPKERKKSRAAARAEKQRLKEQNRTYKKRLKEQKKQAARLKSEAEKSSDKTNKRGYGGWLAAVIALGVSVMVLGSLLAMTYKNGNQTQAGLTGTYEKSFYDLVGYVDNLDNNLAKLQVTNTAAGQQRLLTNVVVQAELAENNVQQLPINDESKSQTAGFINSVGDYAKALINKIAAGETLTDEENANIEKISGIITKLKYELSGLAERASDGYKFESLLKGKEGDIIIGKFSELESSSVEYPKLIYDGPFSAALEKRAAKGLNNLEQVTAEQAREKFAGYFKEYGIKEIISQGEVNGKGIDAYNFSANLNDGGSLFAQISKKGARPVMFNMYADCNTQNFDADTCVSIAMRHLEGLGFEGMKAVWINDNSNVANINFAYTVGDTVIYSDLVKVKVCEEKGRVIGMEANTYFLNHTENRDISAKLTEKQARAQVSSKIDILTQRLCVIPTTGGGEVTAYEFMGTYNGATYYVYINAATGNEADVFRVVATTEGNLLM